MHIAEFEKYIAAGSKKSAEPSFWDAKAEHFARAFDDLDKSRDAVLFDRLLSEKLFDSVKSVVDIGCGIGRHTYHFAEYVDSYLGVDSSAGMLAIAEQNKAKYKLDNCRFALIDWQNCSETFDLVFASMCPAINSLGDIKKLLALSERYVLIKRYLSDADSLLQRLDIAGNGAHNNPDYSYGIINIFWQLGYVPQLFTALEEVEKTYTIDEVQAAYKRVFDNLDESERRQKLELLSEISGEEGSVRSTMRRQFALILVDKQFAL
ncbi:MAG: hypothetical protein CSB19_02310 [Clostridiales bacterium]|nr:MAG: hypothetical protein CSB19_02310 [Clostridiales bacterium]